MLLGSALLISGAVLAGRADAGIRQQHADDVRLQALWLARSALLANVTGERTVETPLGAATVTVAGGTATVEIGGALATVQREPWVERFGAGE